MRFFTLSATEAINVISDHLSSCLKDYQSKQGNHFCIDPKKFPILTELVDKFFRYHYQAKKCHTLLSIWDTHYSCTTSNKIEDALKGTVLNLELDPAKIEVSILKRLADLTRLKGDHLECVSNGSENIECRAIAEGSKFYNYIMKQTGNHCEESYNPDPSQILWSDAERASCEKGLPLFEKFFADRGLTKEMTLSEVILSRLPFYAGMTFGIAAITTCAFKALNEFRKLWTSAPVSVKGEPATQKSNTALRMVGFGLGAAVATGFTAAIYSNGSNPPSN